MQTYEQDMLTLKHQLRHIQDAPQLELLEMGLDSTRRKGCMSGMQVSQIMDHEKRTWPSRSSLIPNEMNPTFGNLERPERLLALALPYDVTSAGPLSKLISRAI